MAMVENVATQTIIKIVLRSRCLLAGRTDDTAKAAEAPQMATAPPERKPSSFGSFNKREIPTPEKKVIATIMITAMTTSRPRAEISWNVI